MDDRNRPATASERVFFRIVSVATGFALGVLLAAVASLRRDTAGFRLRLGAGTFAGFLVGAVLGLVYWRIVGPGAARPAWVRRLASAALALIGIAAFVYPVRFLPHEALPAVLTGLVLAALALSTGAAFLWGLKRFLDRDDERETERQAQNDATTSHENPIHRRDG